MVSSSLTDATKAQILKAIARQESGNSVNYKAQNPTSTASGAYGFIDSTWA